LGVLAGMVEHGELGPVEGDRSLPARWDAYVVWRLEFFADDVAGWQIGSVVEVYAQNVVIDDALADEVLTAAESAVRGLAHESAAAGISPPASFDPRVERSLQQAVVSVITERLIPPAQTYPPGAVVHESDCPRAPDCGCLNYVELVAARARRLDPDLLSELTAAVLAKAQADAFRSIKDPKNAFGRVYRNLRNDVLRGVTRHQRDEEPTDELDRVRTRVRQSADDVALLLLADLLPPVEHNGDWADLWSVWEARSWLQRTRLGRTVLAGVDDGALQMPEAVRNEGRAPFVGVCVMAVVAHCQQEGITRRDIIEQLLRATLSPAVGGTPGRIGHRNQRVKRTTPGALAYVEQVLHLRDNP
jgi:hypothetical protein